MPNSSKPQTKVNFSELRSARGKLAKFVQPHSSSQRPKSASQKALDKLLKSTLTSAGFDLKKFATLNKQREAELRKWAAKRKTENNAQTSAMKPAIQQAIAALRANVAGFNNYALPPASPFQYFLLDTAADISTTSGISLVSSNMAPTNNSAEFLVQTGDSSTQELLFGFTWQNASDKYAVVNVDGYLVLNGYLNAYSQGGDLPDDRESNLYLYAHLYFSGSWQPPATSYPAVSELCLSLQAESGGFFDDGQDVGQSFFRGYDLQYQQQVVPPGGVVTIQVGCYMYYTNSNGQVQYIFEGMGRQVLSPGVLLTVLS